MSEFSYKQVIVFRSDLKLSKGKAVVQAGHAAVSAALVRLQHPRRPAPEASIEEHLDSADRQPVGAVAASGAGRDQPGPSGALHGVRGVDDEVEEHLLEPGRDDPRRPGQPMFHEIWSREVDGEHAGDVTRAAEVERYVAAAVDVSPERPILIDKYLENAIEAEADAIADGQHGHGRQKGQYQDQPDPGSCAQRPPPCPESCRRQLRWK